MSKWRYSTNRIAELEARLDAIDARQAALDIGGPKAEAVRVKSAGDWAEYRALTAEWVLTKNELDRCRVALWRRQRSRIAADG